MPAEVVEIFAVTLRTIVIFGSPNPIVRDRPDCWDVTTASSDLRPIPAGYAHRGYD